MSPLKYADAPENVLRDVLEALIHATPHLIDTLTVARGLDLPDCWLVSGAIYNTVWNHLTGRDLTHGIKDLDLFYFDVDTSWDAEDWVIKRATPQFAPQPPIEIRNQARVHLWYQDHFGEAYPQLQNARQGIDHFACKTHCVGARLTQDGRLDIYAPFGLSDIFSLRVTPNPVLNNRATHDEKAARQKQYWPELTVIPWPE